MMTPFAFTAFILYASNYWIISNKRGISGFTVAHFSEFGSSVRHQVCCGGILHDDEDAEGVSRGRAGEVSRITTSTNRGRRRQLCCGPATYNLSDSVCCWNGSFYQLPIPQELSVGGHAPLHLGCCDHVVYDLQRHLCCDGTLLDRRLEARGGDVLSVGCCGPQPFRSDLELCCSGSTIHRLPEIAPHEASASENRSSSDAAPMQCCGTSTFDPRVQLCCQNGLPVDNPHGTHGRCCGGRVYDEKTELCCASGLPGNDEEDGSRVIHQRASPHTSACCGPRPYRWDRDMCCDGVVHEDVVGGVGEEEEDAAFLECCGNTTYDYEIAKCCDGVLYQDFYLSSSQGSGTELNDTIHAAPMDRFECCGKQLFDVRLERCCGGRIVSVNDNKDGLVGPGGAAAAATSIGCCGQKPYDPSIALCCGGHGKEDDFLIVPTAEAEHRACCGSAGATFDVRSEVCCDGVAIQWPSSDLSEWSLFSVRACCGAAIFDPFLQGCCNGVVFTPHAH